MILKNSVMDFELEFKVSLDMFSFEYVSLMLSCMRCLEFVL